MSWLVIIKVVSTFQRSTTQLNRKYLCLMFELLSKGELLISIKFNYSIINCSSLPMRKMYRSWILREYQIQS